MSRRALIFVVAVGTALVAASVYWVYFRGPSINPGKPVPAALVPISFTTFSGTFTRREGTTIYFKVVLPPMETSRGTYISNTEKQATITDETTLLRVVRDASSPTGTQTTKLNIKNLVAGTPIVVVGFPSPTSPTTLTAYSVIATY